jgi:hyperosmotically inducible periplasmic protein
VSVSPPFFFWRRPIAKESTMKTRTFHLAAAACLVWAAMPLAGCNQEHGAVEVRRDAQGNPSGVHVDGQQVQRNLDHASQELKQGAKDLGHAVERQAEKVEQRVGPVARQVLDDAAITAKVKAKLIADPEVAGTHIDVDTVDGRVTLNGRVSSADERAEAEKLARHTAGVKEVVNLLQAAGQAPPPGTGR